VNLQENAVWNQLFLPASSYIEYVNNSSLAQKHFQLKLAIFTRHLSRISKKALKLNSNFAGIDHLLTLPSSGKPLRSIEEGHA